MGSVQFSVDPKGTSPLMAALPPDAETVDAPWAITVNALNNVVLPAPLGPISTATVGSRTSGRTALRRKRGRSGDVFGMRRSSTTSSRTEW